MNIKSQIEEAIFKAVKTVFPAIEIKKEDIVLEHPTVEEFGDYSTNVALRINKEQGKANSPREIAETIVNQLRKSYTCGNEIEKIEVAGQGFINFFLKNDFLVKVVGEVLEKEVKFGQNEVLLGKKIMVEFAHPNTHKELHIGHMRTLITGEALARIIEASGAKVFRANYQGDVGPHVAKAIWGTQKILDERGQSWDESEKLTLSQKAHLLGEGYVRGNIGYDGDESSKKEINELNNRLYRHDDSVWPLYERTRRWSLDYYDSFYSRFDTKFDHLYFESEIAEAAKKIVLENVGRVFEKSEGAVVFKGEKYGLHTRVFLTADENPTYEGKDMALAPAQFSDFPFDTCLHVVASEQSGYFKVIIKALELLDKKFTGREYHLPMGMVQLVGKKISSRTGVLITVDGLLDEVKNLLKAHTGEEEILEPATVGAVKYSVLKTAPTLNSVFDLEKSVSLDGDSGPYLQYAFARARSVLRKSNFQFSIFNFQSISSYQFTNEELVILRWLHRFPEVVETAARQYTPNTICTYLFELAKRFNGFYGNCPIVGNGFRLALTAAVSIVLRNGLYLLGIKSLEKM